MSKIKLRVLAVLVASLYFSNSPQAATASWYGKGFNGKTTANGETFNKWAMTAASNSHKMGTVLEVTNRANKKKVRVRINDTGGFAKYGRTLDLSRGAFAKIANISQGVINVDIKNIK